MRGQFLLASNESFSESNIYADRSSVVLDWLLLIGINKETFSLREVVRDRGVSLGLVQKVFESLVLQGILQTTGVRTAKRFLLKKPGWLLKNWLERYSIVKKCNMWTYRTGFQSKEQLLRALEKSKFKSQIELALHAAAEAHKCKNTNLQTLELYLLDPAIRLELEKVLQLQPQERGYDVLLIEPYYKSLVRLSMESRKNSKINVASTLLTFLDLYHFPLRGQEQAEFMAERLIDLKRMYK